MKRKSPRALTLTLVDTNRPHLVIEGETFLLRNFSEEGMGIYMPKNFSFPKGEAFAAHVSIGNELYPITLEVVHEADRMIGLRIVEKGNDLRRILAKLLEPTRLAITLSANANSGEEDPITGYHRIWFASSHGAEFLAWFNPQTGGLQSLQLCWLGNWVSRDFQRPVQTGLLQSAYRSYPGTKVADDEILIRHDKPENHLVQIAIQIISSLDTALPAHRLWQFLESGEQVYLPTPFHGQNESA